MRSLFSYVVDHDLGIAPNPFGGFCTLALCKFSHSGRGNIVELARQKDWIAGTGGLNAFSTGQHGKLVYAMEVTEKMTLHDYFADMRFRGRPDNQREHSHETSRFVLVSERFYYFGTRAPSLNTLPRRHLQHPFEKRGPAFRRDFSPAFITDFEAWLRPFGRGVHGYPCGGRPAHAPHCISR